MKVILALLLAIMAHLIVTEAAIGQYRPLRVKRSWFRSRGSVSYSRDQGWSGSGQASATWGGIKATGSLSYSRGDGWGGGVKLDWKRDQIGCGRKDYPQLFEEYDNDKDGLISAEEFAAATGCSEESTAKAIKKADKNGDNGVDRIEFIIWPFIKQSSVMVTNLVELDEFVNDMVSEAKETGANGVKISLTPAGRGSEADEEDEEASEEASDDEGEETEEAEASEEASDDVAEEVDSVEEAEEAEEAGEGKGDEEDEESKSETGQEGKKKRFLYHCRWSKLCR